VLLITIRTWRLLRDPEALQTPTSGTGH
jgi:hypothetical protein